MAQRQVTARAALAVFFALQVLAGSVLADNVTLGSSKDNTLYQSNTGSLSNGAGDHMFAGRNSVIGGGEIRRAVIAFDIAGSVPAGSTITGVTLTLSMSRTSLDAGAQTVRLHRLTADWGEGTSNALGMEGQGAASTPNDATWIHRFFNTLFWTSAGGDFDATASASRVVNAIGSYTWGSTAAMVSDVQGWLDNPASNFGWILIGGEATLTTAKRFDTKEIALAANRPSLNVEFTPPAGSPAGRVPDGDDVPGAQLVVERVDPDQIKLTWDASCLGTDDDYEVYEGTLPIPPYDHEDRFCTTGGATTVTFTPAAGDTYYLVAPRNAGREGSYGTDSAGAERPPAATACLPQQIGACP